MFRNPSIGWPRAGGRLKTTVSTMARTAKAPPTKGGKNGVDLDRSRPVGLRHFTRWRENPVLIGPRNRGRFSDRTAGKLFIGTESPGMQPGKLLPHVCKIRNSEWGSALSWNAFYVDSRRELPRSAAAFSEAGWQ